jgi:hypothetical protein
MAEKYSRTPFIRISWYDEPSGNAENPDNCIFFEDRLHWQFEVGKKILRTAVLGYIFIYVRNKILIFSSLYVYDKWGKYLNHKKM